MVTALDNKVVVADYIRGFGSYGLRNAGKIKESRAPDYGDACGMCGKYYAVTIVRENFDMVT